MSLELRHALRNFPRTGIVCQRTASHQVSRTKPKSEQQTDLHVENLPREVQHELTRLCDRIDASGKIALARSRAWVVAATTRRPHH